MVFSGKINLKIRVLGFINFENDFLMAKNITLGERLFATTSDVSSN